MSRRRDRQGGKGPNQPSEPGIRETLGPEMTVVARAPGWRERWEELTPTYQQMEIG